MGKKRYQYRHNVTHDLINRSHQLNATAQLCHSLRFPTLSSMEWILDYVTNAAIPPWYLLLPLTAILLYWYLTKDFDCLEKYGITAGPKPYPVIGTGLGALKHGIFEWDIDVCRRYRDARVIRAFEMGMPGVTITDPYMAKAILVKEFSHFVNRKDPYNTRPAPLDRCMPLITYDHWRHVRNTVSPTFSAAKLRKMNPLIQERAECMIEILAKHAKTGGAVDAAGLFRAFTMDVLVCTLFGMNIDSLNNKDHPFLKHGTELVQPAEWKIQLINIATLIFPKAWQWMTKVGINPQKDEFHYFTENLEKVLDERRKAGTKSDDFLGLMMDQEVQKTEATEKSSDGKMWTEKGLTRDDILAQMGNLLLYTGFDTTANALTMAAYNLCIHEDMQTKMQEEVDEMLETEDPNYENVQKLTYMDMFINETLRLYGPVNRTVREADVDIDIDGITIPKGVAVWLPVSAYHRDPEIWNDPDTFDPERFTAENKSGRDSSLFMAFSQGPRNCPGVRLANLLLRITLAKILQKTTLSLDENVPREIKMAKWRAVPNTPLEFNVTMRPEIKVTVTADEATMKYEK